MLTKMASSSDKSAVAKIKKIKIQLHESYIEHKKLGKCKEYDRNRRRKKLLNLIERQIKIDKKNINKSCVTWHKLKMTPLIAAIKQRDVEGVRVILSMKASPCISQRDKTDLVSPLEEAVWLGEEEISHILLKNGAAKGKLWWYGALHGAVAFKMFALVRVLIQKGAPLDYVYGGITPLCAALTCGKKRSGDVRMVRLLLEAKADLNKKTAFPRPSNETRKLTLLEISKEYSNENCIRFISKNQIW